MKPSLIERAAFLGRLRILFKVISWVAIIPSVVSAALAIAMSSGDRAAIALTVTMLNTDSPVPDLARWQLLTWSAAFILFTLAALVWLTWIYCATRFLRIAGVERLHHGPLSAVALHFVPVVSYVMPMLFMSELERATRDSAQWRYLNNNRLPAASWLAGKLSMIALLQCVVLQRNAESVEQYVGGLWLMIVATFMAVAGVYLFNRYLKHMGTLQAALAVKIGGRQQETAV